MLQSIEEISSVIRKLSIEIPFTVIESELNKAYKELRSTVNVPGFRKGKVPQAILRKRFSRSVEAEIISKLVPEYYADAVKESGIIPVSQPSIDGEIKINNDSPVLFSATVQVRPEVKDLNYEGIELEKREPTVTEEDIERELELIQKERATYEPTDKEKEIENEDMAIIDYFGSIDGKSIKDIEKTDYQYVLGSQALPNEFSDALLHKKIDDICEFSLLFPVDFQNETVAGKTVDFKVNIKGIKKRVIQPLDDEFAKDLEYETLDELKKAIEKQIIEAKKKEINENNKRTIITELLKRHEIEVPPTMVEDQFNSLVEAEKNYGSMVGMEINLSEDRKATLRQKATDEVKLMMVLNAIGKAENITVEEEDINKYFKQMSLKGGIKIDDLKKYYLSQDNTLEVLRNDIYNDKVLDLVLSKSLL